jgi:serine/threonine-protein kinase
MTLGLNRHDRVRSHRKTIVIGVPRFFARCSKKIEHGFRSGREDYRFPGSLLNGSLSIMKSMSEYSPKTTISVSGRDGPPSLTFQNDSLTIGPPELMNPYEMILGGSKLSWVEQHRLVRRLGSGGQGVVFLCERVGADRFTLPVALKIFSPEGYADAQAYHAAMGRMAQVAVRIAQIQQDNLIDVHNLIEHQRVRVLEMEWVDGFDLHRLLSTTMLDHAREQVSEDRWEHLNDVIVTAGVAQPRLKPGVAINVLRDCLAALSALHREGIVHGDVKPSNIMLKRTGNVKLIDIGSAYEWASGSRVRTCTPSYAAPEVLEGDGGSPQADLASLGYVLVEMLAGAPPFAGINDRDTLLDAKRTILESVPNTLPEEVVRNDLLMNLIGGLIAPDPADRFPSAEAADLVEQGAASFHRQLVHSNLASEYSNEIRVWLQELD